MYVPVGVTLEAVAVSVIWLLATDDASETVPVQATSGRKKPVRGAAAHAATDDVVTAARRATRGAAARGAAVATVAASGVAAFGRPAGRAAASAGVDAAAAGAATVTTTPWISERPSAVAAVIAVARRTTAVRM